MPSQKPDASNQGQGCLYLVATPIGNLADITQRALSILKQSDLVACEDTRKTRPLLKHFGITARTVSYHEHNEASQTPFLAEQIESGKVLALVSDAGTPTISDPGFRLVRECRRRGLPVSPLPGPSAALAALAASGLPSDSFLFSGFPPPKAESRRRFLQKHAEANYTLILYESSHRIEKLMDDILSVFGPERAICSAREMTKIHETFHTGPAGEVCKHVLQDSKRGEFVVLIAKKGYQI